MVHNVARFSSFTKGLNELCDWLSKYNCTDVCMESTGKYWIPVFNILEKNNILVTLSHPKYNKPQKGNKTDRKDGRWICDLSDLKLDDVFYDIFGKSSRSITEQILQHPRETFDVAPFVDGRCKTPI